MKNHTEKLLQFAFAVFALAWTSLAFCGEIHDATKSGDAVKVKALLKGNPDLVFSKDNNGSTPLHFAAYEGHKEVVELLLANHADVNAKNNDGQTAFVMATDWGHKNVAELLRQHGGQNPSSTKVNITIQDAAWSGDLEKVKALLKGSPDLIFSKDSTDNTPLHSAAVRGYKEVVAFLLANQADVNANNENGYRPLHFAAFGGYKDVVALLLANKADVNVKDLKGNTPLYMAVDKRHTEVVELLLANKADVNAIEKSGRTPLHAAASGGYKDVLTLLLDNKAEVNAKNIEGITPLHLAAFGGYKDIVTLLLAHKAEVDAKGKLTPLHFAVVNGDKEMVALLLANKAGPNTETSSGDTPLRLAVLKGHKDVAELLRQHGGQEKRDDSLADSLLEAAKTNNTEIVKKLIAQGAPIDVRNEIYSPLAYACKNKNYELARWLVEHDAGIYNVPILISDDDNHLSDFSIARKEFVAYLVYRKLVQSGMQLAKTDSKAQVEFVRLCKESIVDYLKLSGPWPKEVKGWVLRLSDLDYKKDYAKYTKEGGTSFLVQCDIAVWNESIMYELASTSGTAFSLPSGINSAALSHAWFEESDSAGGLASLSTTYNKEKVFRGSFIVTQKNSTTFSASHIK